VRSFCNYLVRERALLGNPAHEIRAPKAARRLPHTLDADQMAQLLNVAPGEALFARDHALVELLYSSGLRLAELVGLDLVDLDLKDRTVRVLGKGKKAPTRLYSRAGTAAASGRAPCSCASRRGRAGVGLACQCTRTCSDIHSRLIYLNPVENFAACRSSSATLTSPRRRFIPTLTSNTSPAFTTVPTREHGGSPDRHP
jgi:hypothetical protein